MIEGKLDENGYAKVAIPLELAAHPLNIVVYPPPDWSSVWFNVSSGLQIIGGVSSIALACSATLLTGGAATVLSLGLAAWGADQLMTGVNSLVQQQPHQTLMAQGLEQLGASKTYAETLTDMVGFTNATALANLLVKNSAKLGLSTISISLTERKQQVLLNHISLKTTKLNRKFSLRREQLSSVKNKSATVDYPSGISFRIDQPKHLATVDGFRQSAGISGGHNADAFYVAVEKYKVKIVKETPTGVNGITNIEYKILAKHPQTGQPTHYKGNGSEPFKKTVYDPKIFTDKKILELGQEAASSRYKEAITKGLREYEADAHGVTFRIYLQPKTKNISNFHPK